MRIPNLARLAGVAALLVCLAAPAADSASEPVAVVGNLHAHLLDAMQRANELGFNGRTELLRPVIDSSFDFPTIASIVTASHWKAASDSQREAFLDVFRALSTATYASNFSGYEGERFATVNTAEARGARLEDCAFYTDSASDLPMLEVVGRPVAVHPDPALTRAARARGFEIVDWGVPELS